MDLTSFLNESIHDRNIFKAIFIAGPPGSGKSYLTKKLFGFDPNFNLSPFGAKILDADAFYEYKMRKGVEDNDWYDSQTLRDKQFVDYSKKYLPLVINIMGNKPEITLKKAQELKDIGYDVYMIYVKTPIEIAIQRDAQRDRVCGEAYIRDMFEIIEKEFHKYITFFGKENMLTINNNKVFRTKKEELDFYDKLYKEGRRILTSPIKNPIGKKKALLGKYQKVYEK